MLCRRFDDFRFSGTNIGMCFRSIITCTDCYIGIERANRGRARRRRRRISNDRNEIGGHKRPLAASSKSFLKQITRIMPHFDADQLLITVIFGAAFDRRHVCPSSANVSVGPKAPL
jgi:hypothetical protein